MSISSVIECDSCGVIGMGMDHKSGGAAKARSLLREDGWKTGLKGGLDKCRVCAVRARGRATTNLHPLDELPPPDLDYPYACVSVRVLLVYADGATCEGWYDLCSGWARFGDKHAVEDLDDDELQPIGWRML